MTQAPTPGPLWMMHVLGPDDIYPAPDHVTAVEWCAALNASMPASDVLCVAVPAIWIGTPEAHAEGLSKAVEGWTSPPKRLAPTAPVEASGSERDHRFVPGVMRCAKCNFVVVRRVFSAIDGTVGDGDNKTEPCPNGCGPLWPMTWEQNSRDMEERCEAAVLEAANLRAQLALRPQPSGETREAEQMALNIICDPGIITGLHTAAEARDWIEKSVRAALLSKKKPTSEEGDARRRLISIIEQWDGESEYDAEDCASLADDILHAFNGSPVLSSSALGYVSADAEAALKAGINRVIYPAPSAHASFPLYAAPVPAQDDDKLRIAVEALERYAEQGYVGAQAALDKIGSPK